MLSRRRSERTNPGRDGTNRGNGGGRGIHQKAQLLATDEQGVHDGPERATHDQRVSVVIEEDDDSTQEAHEHCHAPRFCKLEDNICKTLSTPCTQPQKFYA